MNLIWGLVLILRVTFIRFLNSFLTKNKIEITRTKIKILRLLSLKTNLKENPLEVSEVFLNWLLRYTCSKSKIGKMDFYFHYSSSQLISNRSKKKRYHLV